MTKYSPGFSLLELLIVLALSVGLYGIAVPCYQHFIGRNQLRVAADELVLGVELAKRQALREGERVLFYCVAGGQRLVREGDGRVLALLPPLQGVRVQWRSNLGLSDYIRFEGNGLPDGQWGSFWLSAHGQTLRVIMNGAGRTQKAC